MTMPALRSGFAKSLLASVCLVAVTSSASLVAQVPAGSPATGVFNQDQSIVFKGNNVVSPSGDHVLVFERSGDISVYSSAGAKLWSLSQVFGGTAQAAHVTFLGGNITVYDKKDRPIWSALTPVSDSSAQITLEPDGVLRLRSKNNPALVTWSSGPATALAAAPAAAAPAAPVSASPTPTPAPAAGGSSIFATSSLATATALGLPPGGGVAPTPSPAPASTPSPAPAPAVAPAPAPAPAAVAAAPAGGVTVPPGATTPTSGFATDFPIRPGQGITPGRKYVSPDGQHYLQFAADGNMFIKTVRGDGYRWGFDQQGFDFRKATQIILLPNGNLAAGNVSGDVVWAPVGSDAATNSFMTLENGILKVVAPSGQVTWSSDEARAAKPSGFARLPLPPYNGGRCTPDAGFAKCRVIDNPRITILGTSRVSDSAMNFVQKVYTDMFNRLTPAYPKDKMNFVKVVITNGETSAELAKVPGVGDNGRNAADNDQLRGGGGANLAWITEQMICKTGVKTRGPSDTAVRTVDQVVHEMGHTMDFRFDRRKKTEQIYKGLSIPAEEGLPIAIQNWFSAPTGIAFIDKPAFTADMQSMFSSRTTYSCSDYKP